jgi:hypothetical protein
MFDYFHFLLYRLENNSNNFCCIFGSYEPEQTTAFGLGRRVPLNLQNAVSRHYCSLHPSSLASISNIR